MNALFFILFTLFTIVVQTIILPLLPFFMQTFDLMIINILFMCLVSTHYTIILAIILIGIIMDSISGAPFCFHLFSYLWIYILVYLVQQLLFQKSIIFILVISVVSVAIQQGLLLFSIFVVSSWQSVLDFDYSLLIQQIFFGFAFIPAGVWLADLFHKQWMKTGKTLFRQWHKARHS